MVEFDHLQPVARGGQASTENIRLLCRAHNQWEAERVFGADFIEQKREGSGGQRAEPREGQRSREDDGGNAP
jgi:hypothetical protein